MKQIILLAAFLCLSAPAWSEVRFAISEQEPEASRVVDGCPTNLVWNKRWSSLRYHNSCRQGTAAKLANLDELLTALTAEAGAEMTVESVYLGRLLKVLPALLQHTAVDAYRSEDWNNDTGRLTEPGITVFVNENRFVAKSLATTGFLQGIAGAVFETRLCRQPTVGGKSFGRSG